MGKNNTLVGVTFVLMISFLTNCKAQESHTKIMNQRTINVTGTAETEVTPDIIEFALTLKEYWKEEFEAGKKYEDYKTKIPMTKIEPQVLEQLEKAGVKKNEIKVSAVGNFYRQTGKEILVSKTLVLKLSSFEVVDQIIKSVSAKGINNMMISDLRHSDMIALKKQVRIDALKNAKTKATYLLESMDEKCGEVLMISETQSGYQPPVMYRANLKANSEQGSSSATELRKIKIKYEINATFAIAK